MVQLLQIYYMIKMISLLDENPTEEKLIKICGIINKVYPHVVAMSHIGYENARDIFELDRNVLSTGLKRMGDNEKSFEFKF